MSKILDGKKLSGEIAEDLNKKIGRLRIKPKLVIIQVGGLSESNTYIKHKKNFAEKIGALVEHKQFKNTVKESKLLVQIEKCNSDKSIHGIIVQLPLPKHLSPEIINEAINESKKVDGGKFFLPATTQGIITLLERYKISIPGKKVVVVGRSELVGKPTALALLDQGATVTVCHRGTKDLKSETTRAQILVVAAGKPKLITEKHVSPNQVVIDVGININNKRKLVGDVDFEKVKNIVKAITPVPGGVGPMTVASLFENLLKAYKLQAKGRAE